MKYEDGEQFYSYVLLQKVEKQQVLIEAQADALTYGKEQYRRVQADATKWGDRARRRKARIKQLEALLDKHNIDY